MLAILQRILAKITTHHHILAKHLKGNPALLFKNGNFIEGEIEKHNISLDDALEALRFQVKKRGLNDVQEIYLERNGKISFIMK